MKISKLLEQLTMLKNKVGDTEISLECTLCNGTPEFFKIMEVKPEAKQ